MKFYRPRRRNEITTGALSSAINDNINGRSTSTPLLTGGISNSYYPTSQSDTQSGNNMSLTGALGTAKNIKGFFGGSGGSGGGGTPWGAIGQGAKTGYNTIFQKTDENGYDDYSDFEEPIVYAGQGASQMAQFGPWAALGGALYGLGYGFKDDVGLEDNNWLTDIIFPIGMGDEHQGFISL